VHPLRRGRNGESAVRLHPQFVARFVQVGGAIVRTVTRTPPTDARQLSRVIFDYAGRIGREQDRERLIGIIATMGRDLVGADRCTIWLADPASGQLVGRFAHGGVIPIPLGHGLVGHCVATGETVLSNDPVSDPRFASTVDRHTGYRTHAVLTVPMRTVGGDILGAFQAINKPGGFTDGDAELLELAAAYAARTVETQELLRTAEATRRVAHDLEIAREVQQRLLAGAHTHEVPGIEFAATCRPASEVGGDYYDLLPLPGGRVAVAVGDISGKGIAAALMMASVQATLHALVLQDSWRPADLVARLNQSVLAAATGRYSTLFLAVYDPAAHTLTAVNGGHCYPLVVRGDEIIEATEGGPPIGLLPGARYAQQDIPFAPGDSLVCFTDGLTEAQNAAGDLWMDHGCRPTLIASAVLPGAQMIATVIDAATSFVAGAPQHDDMTVVHLRVTPPQQP
jgi:phosphoserine phosphatase RsbU/P